MGRNRVLSFLKTPTFKLKEYLHRRPQNGFSWQFSESQKADEARQLSATLDADGIVMLPGFFKGDQLRALQEVFGTAVEGKVNKHDPDSLLNLDFIPESPEFMNAATESFLLDVVAGYYQRPFAIGRTSAMRILPIKPLRDSSFQWHHDARGRQVHLMIILNDLPPDGQRMSYLKRSHHRYYDHYRGLAEGSRFEKDLKDNPPPAEDIVEVCGPAGTVAIFDANGLHCGNRNENGRRDTLTFCYVSKRHFKPVRYKRELVDKLPEPANQVVTFNPFHELVD